MQRILVVDDDRDTCEVLQMILSREGYEVSIATSGDAALAQLHTQEVDLLLCDVKMPEMDGLTLLRQVKAEDSGLVVVMMSGHHDVAAAVEAMKQGAFDYLVKPLGRDDVLRSIQRVLAVRALRVENLVLKRQVRDQVARAQVIGSSPPWRRVCELVEQVAPSRATVLLTGESGTGKEVLAGWLHRLSDRAKQPFIVLNAAAMPATLLEAELFGYEKGAFTDATHGKPGHFELADGGTLFLDEVGDMPPEVQVKLLRVLQDGTFQRLGGTHSLQVNVRVVAATNKDLVQEVAAERFRQDLYYRLNVISIRLPPLRERRQDIPLLLAHFLQKYSAQNGKAVMEIQHEALQRLQAYAWPGNVRELENVIERAVVLSPGPTISLADLSLDESLRLTLHPDDCFVLPANATLAQVERELIYQALQRSNGNRQAAARQLAIGTSTLYRKLKEYHLM
jgi:two-component system, NtrC family, response regulator HydG